MALCRKSIKLHINTFLYAIYRDASSEDGEEVQEKCDPEKDEDNDYSLEDKGADHQVIRPKLDYTDMDAVD